MTDIAPYDFQRGEGPLLVSMPHVGLHIPDDIAQKLHAKELALHDTDWHVDALYDFLPSMGVSVLKATHSRTVVDLNRPADNQSLYPGQATTGLCPTECFDGTPLYKNGMQPNADEVARRVKAYWQPYHAKIAAELKHMKEAYGFAFLWDAHSIKTHVPRLFDGALPDLNFGTHAGLSCDGDILADMLDIAHESGFSVVANARFKGGYITRHYGAPHAGVHALQLELAQSTYLADGDQFEIDEFRANRLRPVLKHMLDTLRQIPPS